jgi:hypothetical protein
MCHRAVSEWSRCNLCMFRPTKSGQCGSHAHVAELSMRVYLPFLNRTHSQSALLSACLLVHVSEITLDEKAELREGDRERDREMSSRLQRGQVFAVSYVGWMTGRH